MNKPKVIIIGAGIGGLGTSILLARNGYEITIFEKNGTAGGRCQQITKQGHIFDTGPTMYLFPQIYAKFFSLIGENIQDHLKLLRCDPSYLLNFSDNINLTLTTNMEQMKTQLESLEPGSYKMYQKLHKESKKLYNFALNNITQKDLKSPLDYFTLYNLYFTLRQNALYPHYAYIGKFFKNPYLRALFTFQDSYLGLDPFKTPSLFSLLSYEESEHGNFLPKGGMYKIIEALENITKKYSINIKYNSPIKSIETENNRVRSVILDNNTQYHADYIICNTDLSYAYNNLLINDPYTKNLKNKKYSCSVCSFHWALDKHYPQLKTHNIFFSDNYHAGFDQVVNKTMPPQKPHFYVQAPTRTDPTRAPVGHDTLSVIVPINHIQPLRPIDWELYNNQLKKYIFKRFTNIGIDIEKHIKFEVNYTPLDWQNHLNLTYGSVYGLHHNLTQIGYLRPKRTHDKYSNLFFVGSSNHPGSGLPTVLLSSIFTAQRIIEN